MADLSTFKDTYFLQGLSNTEISTISSLFTEKSMGAGTTVFLENMPGESVYFVHKGIVRVTRMLGEGEEKTLVLLGPGDIFGEMGLLDGGPRSVTARVMEESKLLILKKSDFDGLISKNSELALKVMRNIVHSLVQRLRENEQEYRDMLALAVAPAR